MCNIYKYMNLTHILPANRMNGIEAEPYPYIQCGMNKTWHATICTLPYLCVRCNVVQKIP